MSNKSVTTTNAFFYKMSDGQFHKFREIVYENSRIHLSKEKKTMLTARLLKRIWALKLTSFSEYLNYIQDSNKNADEIMLMIDVVSTHKTDFFREPAHFDFLSQKALPGLLKSKKYSTHFNVWSAASSTGEEAYSLAMVMSEFIKKHNKHSFRILATDISNQVLDVANKAIYQKDLTDPIPPFLKKKYMMRGKGDSLGMCRIIPKLRQHVNFKQLNLLENKDFGLKTTMDIIFCRNVIIYFDKKTQKQLFSKIYSQLSNDGYLFIGHSETLYGISKQFTSVSQSVYKKI